MCRYDHTDMYLETKYTYDVHIYIYIYIYRIKGT